jgi:hypothetical protein
MLADPAILMFFALGNMSASDTGAFWDENGLAALEAMTAGAARFNACVNNCAEATCVRYSPADGSCLQVGERCWTLLPGARGKSTFNADAGWSREQQHPKPGACLHPGSVTCVPAACFNRLPVLRVGCAQTPTAANRTGCSTLGGPNLSPPPVLGATSFGGYVWNGTRLVADNVALRASWLLGPARHIEHAYAVAVQFGIGSGSSPYEVVSMLMASTVYTTSRDPYNPNFLLSVLSPNLQRRHPNSAAVLSTLASIPPGHFLRVL